jgi:hypothetical protein
MSSHGTLEWSTRAAASIEVFSRVWLRNVVRPSGFETPTFCSGEKSDGVFFILRPAQRGCERDLRGIQRLLCTLLCTRSIQIQIQFVHPPPD